MAEPTKFAIVERYEEQSDVQTHVNNPYYKLFGAYVKPLLAGPLVCLDILRDAHNFPCEQELHSLLEMDTSKEVEVPPQTWSTETDN